MPNGEWMPINTVRWLRLALDDMDEIITWLATREGMSSATCLAHRLWDAGESLKNFPSRGRLGKIPGTRELCLKDMPYFLTYQVLNNEVRILRVIHFSRSYPQ